MPDAAWRVPLAWGARGLDRLAVACDALVLVDALSFGTAVDVALSAGATVFPGGEDPAENRALADSVQGVLAVSRGEPGFSLSPASLRSIPPGTRLVLPARNGGALAARAVAFTREVEVYVACLRNAVAVAAAVRAAAQRPGLVAAGERRRGDTIRYAREDQLGAGAVAASLGIPLSPAAAVAAAAFRSAGADLEAALFATRSGRELHDRGFDADVRIAAQTGVSQVVPQLEGKMILRGPRPARGSALLRWFDGPRLVSMPARRSDKDLVLAEVMRRLDLGEAIPEARLNELLAAMHPDFCTLRRELVDAGLLARERGIYRPGDPAA
jgi:2-phosphosulfolactate phosphatase